MQDLSYTFQNTDLDLAGWPAQIMVYTFENAYSLDPERSERFEQSYVCRGLLTNGGQSRAEGTVRVRVGKEGKSVRVGISVSKMDHRVRSVKLVLTVGAGKVANLLDRRAEGAEGIYRYPEGWRTLDVPILIWAQRGGGLKYFRSVSGPMSPRTFAVLPEAGATRIELIYEPPACGMTDGAEVPDWEFGIASCPEEVYRRHTEELSCRYGWKSWEERPDVPNWMREVALVACIHGQHWTGYIFNDYAAMERMLDVLARLVEGRRVLAYLPGWEGRYYFGYGEYRPDGRMGGEAGFARLCDSAREKGIHLMPMYGMHMAARGAGGYEEWGGVSELATPSGNRFSGSVDWDGSRHYDHNTNAQLNPGAPRWQNRLVEQIRRVSERYRLEAAFLDISAMYCNDPRYDVYEGVRRLAERLKGIGGGLLLAGEAWYDRLADVFPLVQSGHTNGPLNWYDEIAPEHFETYCRSFAHLLLGDPSRGSTGVHELGCNEVREVPLRKGILPTVSIVEDTLAACPEGVERAAAQANEYAKRYLR